MENEQKQVRQFVRVLNTDIPGKLSVSYGLTKIKGIGMNLAHAFCARQNIPSEKAIHQLTDVEVKDIEAKLKVMKGMEPWLLNRQRDCDTGDDMHLLATDLKFRKDSDIKNLQKIRAYRGMRHAAGLPVRGQRTKAHFRKGSAVGVAKKPKVGKT